MKLLADKFVRVKQSYARSGWLRRVRLKQITPDMVDPHPQRNTSLLSKVQDRPLDCQHH